MSANQEQSTVSANIKAENVFAVLCRPELFSIGASYLENTF